MASSIPGAVAALHTLLAAAATTVGHALEGIQVAFAPPAAEEQEVVAILGVPDAAEAFAALGANRHEETYRIAVTVKAYRPSNDGIETFTRAYALAEGVRAVVNANRTLSNTVTTAHVAGQPSPEGAQPADGGGFFCFVDVLIECTHRIS